MAYRKTLSDSIALAINISAILLTSCSRSVESPRKVTPELLETESTFRLVRRVDESAGGGRYLLVRMTSRVMPAEVAVREGLSFGDIDSLATLLVTLNRSVTIVAGGPNSFQNGDALFTKLSEPEIGELELRLRTNGGKVRFFR